MGKRLDDDALRRIIREMADGPAGAPLEDAQLQAELAYHRSLIDGTPFVARVAVTRDMQSGEVAGGDTLRAEVDGKSIDITRDGQVWKVAVPPTAAITLIAQRNGKRTTLEPGRAFSHAPAKR